MISIMFCLLYKKHVGYYIGEKMSNYLCIHSQRGEIKIHIYIGLLGCIIIESNQQGLSNLMLEDVSPPQAYVERLTQIKQTVADKVNICVDFHIEIPCSFSTLAIKGKTEKFDKVKEIL